MKPETEMPFWTFHLCEKLCKFSRRCWGSAAFLLADSPAYILCRLLPRPLREKVCWLSLFVSEWKNGYSNSRYGPKNTVTNTAVQRVVNGEGRLYSFFLCNKTYTYIHTALVHWWYKHIWHWPVNHASLYISVCSLQSCCKCVYWVY